MGLVALAVALSSSPSAGRAATLEADRARAIELFRASQGAYEAGRFGEAAALLEEAHGLDPNPILLYNLARARESQGELGPALDAYRQYLRASPDAEDRAAVESRIGILTRQLDERARLEALVEEERRAREAAAREAEAARAAAVARSAQASGPDLLPWVVTGLGAAGVAAGVVLGLTAQDRAASADDAPSQVRASALADEADGLAQGANVAYVVGGVVAAVGVVWGIVAATRGEDVAPPGVVARF